MLAILHGKEKRFPIDHAEMGAISLKKI